MPFTWQTKTEKNKRKNYQQAYQSPLRYLGQTKVLVGVLLGCFVLFLCLCNYLITFFLSCKRERTTFRFENVFDRATRSIQFFVNTKSARNISGTFFDVRPA